MADQDVDNAAPPPGATGEDGSGKPDSPAAKDSSLTDDLLALIDDGKTYVDAEVQFQKSRALFALDRGRSGALYALVAFTLLWLALVALVVGLVIALTPEIGPWAATALVVVALVAAGAFFAWRARQKFARLAAAYRDSQP